MAGHGTAVGQMQPDRFCLGDEVTNGENDALADQHAVAAALGPERLGGERIGGNHRPQPHQCRESLVEIVVVVFRLGLQRRRHLPIG